MIPCGALAVVRTGLVIPISTEVRVVFGWAGASLGDVNVGTACFTLIPIGIAIATTDWIVDLGTGTGEAAARITALARGAIIIGLTALIATTVSPGDTGTVTAVLELGDLVSWTIGDHHSTGELVVIEIAEVVSTVTNAVTITVFFADTSTALERNGCAGRKADGCVVRPTLRTVLSLAPGAIGRAFAGIGTVHRLGSRAAVLGAGLAEPAVHEAVAGTHTGFASGRVAAAGS